MCRYRMDLALVFGIDTPCEVVGAVIKAIRHMWPFEEIDDWEDPKDGPYWLSGEGKLAAGETEEEFAAKLRDKVWGTAKQFVGIQLYATALDPLPYTVFDFDNVDYDQFVMADRSESTDE